jgi:hypothetical protein
LLPNFWLRKYLVYYIVTTAHFYDSEFEAWFAF